MHPVYCPIQLRPKCKSVSILLHISSLTTVKLYCRYWGTDDYSRRALYIRNNRVGTQFPPGIVRDRSLFTTIFWFILVLFSLSSLSSTSSRPLFLYPHIRVLLINAFRWTMLHIIKCATVGTITARNKLTSNKFEKYCAILAKIRDAFVIGFGNMDSCNAKSNDFTLDYAPS